MLCGGKYAVMLMCTFLKFMCMFCSVKTTLLFSLSSSCGYNFYMLTIHSMNSDFYCVIIVRMRFYV